MSNIWKVLAKPNEAEFWDLWAEADGATSYYDDVANDAAYKINLMIALRLGAELKEATMRGFVITIKRDARAGWCSFRTIRDMFQDEWDGIRRYAQDVDAASRFLELPDGWFMTVYTSAADNFQCSAFVTDNLNRKYRMVNSIDEARARVGAWWAAVTGEAKPE